MKIYKNILYPLLLIIVVCLFISCDVLFPAPLGRDNFRDNEVQIGRFVAAVSGYESITTAWDWRDPPPGIDDSRIIDKIRIVHSKNNRPDSKYPLNPDNVIKLDSNSTWQYGWNNLSADRDHYFALYAHEKGGIWLAPKYSDQYLGSNVYEERWDTLITKLYIDTSSASNTVGETAINIRDLPTKVIGFLRFDELFYMEFVYQEFGAVLDAQIQGFGITFGGNIDIVPVRFFIESGMFWGEISNSILYDYEHSITVTINGPLDIIDIKDQINVARVYGSSTIALIPSTASAIDINDISSLTFSDPGPPIEDLFGVWRNN